MLESLMVFIVMTVTLLLCVGLWRKFFPDSWAAVEASDGFDLPMLLLMGVVLASFGVGYLVGRPIFFWLIEGQPELVIPVMIVVLGLFLIFAGGWLFIFFARRIANALGGVASRDMYTDSKIARLIGVLIAGGCLLLYQLLSIGFGIILLLNLNDLSEDPSVVLMDESRDDVSDEPIILDNYIRAAARNTCLYDNEDLSGDCTAQVAQDRFALLFFTWQQRDPADRAFHVMSLDPDSLLESGWTRVADWREVESVDDKKAALEAILTLNFRPAMLQAIGLDLLIGSIIALVLILIFRETIRHYTQSILTANAFLIMGLRYTIVGSGIHPLYVFLIEAGPLLLGALIEWEIIERFWGRAD